ncbi:hypothetical protein D4R71_00540 [bacterium]|nr:MAG: hypothetical protein D4R71_00540 [bacterium]
MKLKILLVFLLGLAIASFAIADEDWAEFHQHAADVDKTAPTEDQALVYDDVLELFVPEDIVTLIGGDDRYLKLDTSNDPLTGVLSSGENIELTQAGGTNPQFKIIGTAYGGFRQLSAATDYSVINLGMNAGVGGYCYIQSASSGTGTTMPFEIWLDNLAEYTFTNTAAGLGMQTNNITNAGAISAAGAITGGTLTDGTLSITGGNLTTTGNISAVNAGGTAVLYGDYLDVGGAGVGQAYVTDGTHYTSFSDGTYAINATGTTVGSSVNPAQVAAQFTSQNTTHFGQIGSNAVAGYFTDGASVTELCDDTYGVDTTGNIRTGTMTLGSGSITDTGGAIDFGNETLTTLGHVGIGLGPLDNRILEIYEVFTNQSGGKYGTVSDSYLTPAGALSGTTTVTGLLAQGQWFESTVDGAGANKAYVHGIEGNAITGPIAGAGNLYELIGIYGRARHRTLADVTTAIGIKGDVFNDASGSAFGDITSAYSFMASADSDKATGVIGTRYGLYVEDLATAAHTDNQYGIYCPALSGATGDNLFIKNISADSDFGSGAITTTGTGTFGNLTANGNTTLGSGTEDSITINADAITVANDTDITLSGGANGLSFDSTTLSIDAANGRVGIGTTTPTSKLEITDGTGYVITEVEGVNLEGPLDVNGSITLDKTTIHGPTQSYSSLTVGEDASGYDVKFYGTSTGNYLLWDQANNKLQVLGKVAIGSGANTNADDANDLYIAGDLEVDGSTWLGDAQGDSLTIYGTLTTNEFAFSGTLDMNNNLITNIGNAGTDFTSGGGLTLAGDLTANSNIVGDGATDLTSMSDATFDGTVQAEHLSSTDDITATDTLTAATLTDGSLSITSGSISSGVDATFSGTVQAEQLTSTDDANITDTLTAGTLTDGTLSISSGDITSGSDATFSGTIQGGTLYDGTLSIASGNLTTTGTGTFSGIQNNGTLTVGQDTTGYDLKCYGATTGRYLQWQSDADTLKVIGGTGSVATGTEAVNLEGPLDVNGSITLDKTTIYGPTQSYSSLTVGEDTSGHDIKFYGSTPSCYMLWDTSADDLLLVGTTDLICDGTVRSNAGFNINGTSGWSGWFDDGTNFRVTVTNGIVTAVGNSVAGGHNP